MAKDEKLKVDLSGMGQERKKEAAAVIRNGSTKLINYVPIAYYLVAAPC